MHKKYLFPIMLFLIFDKTKIVSFSSKYLAPNHYFLLINSSWFYIFNQVLKKEFFFSNSLLLDASAIDTLKYSKISEKISLTLQKNRLLLFYIYYFQFLKLRLTILTPYNSNNSHKLPSVDNIFKNANWVERELSEMFGVNYSFKLDIRKLLLDYSKNENPMLKDFPCGGYSDVFYNVFEDQVVFNNTDVIEL